MSFKWFGFSIRNVTESHGLTVADLGLWLLISEAAVTADDSTVSTTQVRALAASGSFKRWQDSLARLKAATLLREASEGRWEPRV